MPFTIPFLKDCYTSDSVIFLAEGVLFRVPIYPLIEGSPAFASKHSIRPNEIGTRRGGYEIVDCIVLPNIAPEDFACFLDVLFIEVLSKDACLSAFKLAAQWKFEGARRRIIDTVGRMKIDPVEKIELGRESVVLPWVRAGYVELVTRNATPQPDTGKRIGYTEAFSVFELREWWHTVLSVLSPGGTPTPAALAHLDRRIQLTFAKEFNHLARLEEEQYAFEGRSTSKGPPLMDRFKQSIIHFLAYAYVMILG